MNPWTDEKCRHHEHGQALFELHGSVVIAATESSQYSLRDL